VTLPTEGTLVYLEHRSGDWWDGEGVLTEVSPDQTQCQVAARNRILFVETKWVPCKYVHERSPRMD
jgi:hypothetical protein